MAVIEGPVSGTLAGVGAEVSKALHVGQKPPDYGSLGMYRLGAESGVMAAALGANAELFQFRWSDATRFALVYRVTVSAGAGVAATAAAGLAFHMTAARAWSVIGSGGTRQVLTTNNAKLRTSMGTSLVNDAGISTTAGLTAGTKTLDGANMGSAAIGVGTGAITVAANLNLLPDTDLFNAFQEGGHPLVLAGTGGGEGFVIRNGAVAWPATMTWKFAVQVVWAEVAVF